MTVDANTLSAELHGACAPAAPSVQVPPMFACAIGTEDVPMLEVGTGAYQTVTET